MAFSPADSRTLITTILDPRAGTPDLWLIDLTKDSIAPQTTTRGFAGNPVWSADGRRLAYHTPLPNYNIHQIFPHIHSSSPSIGEHPVAWSHNGASLLVFTYDDQTTYLSSWSFASRTLTRPAEVL